MPILKSEAIVLRRFAFGNTSQIGQLLTRDFGKVSLLAKGIQSPKKKEREVFDLLCHYGIVFQKKKHTSLHLLRELHVYNHFPEIRDHLEALYVALHIAELVQEGVKEEEPFPELFDLMLEGLLFLNNLSGRDWRAFLIAFELKYLKFLGYLPEIHFCLACKKALDPPSKAFFSNERGGILCESCKSLPSSFTILSRGALSILRNLSNVSHFGLCRIRLLPAQARELRILMGDYISHVLEKKLMLNQYLIDF